MTNQRRKFLKNMGFAMPILASPLGSILAKDDNANRGSENTANISFSQNFKDLNDKVWIGKSFWAVPMEDWQIQKGRLEFLGVEKNSRLHLLTHTLNEGEGNFSLIGKLGLLDKKEGQGSLGFTIGIKDSTDPSSIKAACYFGKGISLGVTLDGSVFVDDKKADLPSGFSVDKFSIKLDGVSTESNTQLKLTVTDKNGKTATLDHAVQSSASGLVAMENNIFEENGSTFFWDSIALSGSKIDHEPKNSFGPILWSMYTLSRNILKLTAQMPPLGSKDAKNIELQMFRDDKWEKEAVAKIDPISFTALFTIGKWNATQEMPYRLVYEIDNEKHHYKGIIREEPLNGHLVLGGLTCQHAMGYPYRPLIENLEKSNPDIMFFSGDQIYEGNGGYPIKRQPEERAILSYLGKWYMFGWAFGHIMRDRPTICTPDDHDVFQGNLWGEGGKAISFEDWKTKSDANGGFVQTPKMVNAVNKTQCGHLPDAYDKTPLESGITNWYTQLVYGRVSFAVVSDRLFKSGPEKIRMGKGRIDHLREPAKPQDLDSSSLSFFGDRQTEFLNDWITDWENADMKVLLSQTLFSNVGTHHGTTKDFLFGDLDSGGWPKMKRDDIIKILRKGCSFHINGDQHLPFIVQYSVDEVRDGGWTFCTPAISTGYPRWGQPDSVNTPFSDRPKHDLPNTGNYRDGFGNINYIYAVGNPEDNFDDEYNRYQKAQKKASGYSIVTFDTLERTIKMEAIRFLANLEIASEENTYPGWPLQIDQSDNDGRRPLGYLPKLILETPNQVLKIIDETSNELITAIRIKGSLYVPSVFELSKYTLIIGEGMNEKTFKGVEITVDPKASIKV